MSMPELLDARARIVPYVKGADVRQDVVSAQKPQSRRHLVVGQSASFYLGVSRPARAQLLVFTQKNRRDTLWNDQGRLAADAAGRRLRNEVAGFVDVDA